jgi:signal transduction histidine kinase
MAQSVPSALAPDSPAQHVAELQAQLAALQAEMQDFTSTVSHDLRAPLRHIVSFAQLVREDAGPQLSEEVQGFLNTICDSAHTMGLMLDRLLELSRIGTAPVLVEAVALQPLVQAAVDAQKAAHPTRTIAWHLPPGMPHVLADAALLQQAVRLVLANAVQFTASKPQAEVHISTVADEANGLVTLHVQDNGIGINPELSSQLFHPFKRLHSPRQGAGLGMGLAQVRKIMERLGGTASLQGAVGQGCTLRLTLLRGTAPASTPNSV